MRVFESQAHAGIFCKDCAPPALEPLEEHLTERQLLALQRIEDEE
jgi:hypothetical protein